MRGSYNEPARPAAELEGIDTAQWNIFRALPRAIFLFASNLMPAISVAIRQVFGPGARGERWFERMWFVFIRWGAGLRVEFHGTPAVRDNSVLFVSNHISYLDIAVVGERLDAAFIAKSDIGQWPILGGIVSASRSIMVKRDGSDAAIQLEHLLARMRSGEDIIIFPEGTTGDGRQVLPFKSTLFACAERLAQEGTAVTVQPVTIAYVRDGNGNPLDERTTDLFAWYGDDDLAPHVWRLLGFRGGTVSVTFGEPVDPALNDNRKRLSAHCWEVVSATLSQRLEEMA